MFRRESFSPFIIISDEKAGPIVLFTMLALHVFVPVVATTVLASAFIVLRFVARRITRVSLWWDDYMAIAAFFFAIAWVAVVLRCKPPQMQPTCC